MTKMKSIFFLIATLTLSLGAWARGGDEINNGGGLAEKYFLVAYNSIESYAAACLKLEACRLDPEEKKILNAIVAAMPAERQVADQLRFDSEKANPGFFQIDGQMKIAKTGSKVGDPIYINTDLLYFKNKFGEAEAISLSNTLAVLLHELGHHVTTAPCSTLDLMGVKVGSFWQRWIQSTPLLPWSQSISATIIQNPELNSFPKILLTIGDRTSDISDSFYNALNCPKFNIPIPVLPFPDLQFGHEKPLGTVLSNVHWEVSPKDGGGKGEFTIIGNLSHVCPSGSAHLVNVNSFVARINFSTDIGQNGKPVARTFGIEQDYQPWYKLLQFKR